MAARLPEICDISRAEVDTEMATEGANEQGSTWRTDDKEGRQDDEFIHYLMKCGSPPLLQYCSVVVFGAVIRFSSPALPQGMAPDSARKLWRIDLRR